MDDDGPSSALEAFKALHHPERKAAEKLLITNGLREAEKRKMRQYGHLVNEPVGFMAVPFSAFGSTVPRVAKLSKGMAKRQMQDEVWDSLGRTTNLNPMATCLQFSYANLSLLFARFHAKSYLGTTIARTLCNWASATERRTTTMRKKRSWACR